MNYQPLHIDWGFLKTKSLNVCIPATAYGNEYSGIGFHKRSNGETKSIYDKDAIEPFVQLGEALIFPETTIHKRTVKGKKKIRINTELRLFPEYTKDTGNIFNLKKIPTFNNLEK